MWGKKRQYDEEMIRDFMRHLRAEVTMCLFHAMREGQTPSKELMAELAWFSTKYDVCGLLPTMETDTTEVPEDCVPGLLKDIQAARARELKNALDAIEALGPILAESLLCLRQPHRLPKTRVRLADVMAKLRASGIGDLGKAAC